MKYLILIFFLLQLNNERIGKATWYGAKLHGNKTASGEIFDMNGMTAASNFYKLGDSVKVTNLNNDKSVTVKINDRMGAKHLIDLSVGAFKKIANPKTGVLKVRVVKL